MKKIIAIALVAALGASVQSFAQSPDENVTSAENTAGNCKQICTQAPHHKKHDRRGAKHRANRPDRRRDFVPVDSMIAFDGITLTSEQSASIAKINDETRQAVKKAIAERKAERQANRKTDKACCGDSNKMKKNDKAPLRPNPRMQARLDYFIKIQQVLTTEQYIKFLENTAASVPAPRR